MTPQLTPHEARAALDTIERRRQTVIAEIDLPRWYWWGLALGWIALGVIADVGSAWLAAVATFAFGAVHAAVAGRVISGRHRTDDLSVSARVAGRRTPVLVIGGLLVLVALTIAGSVAVSADGADHPTTIASVFVAVIILLGGPHLLGVVRRRAARDGAVA